MDIIQLNKFSELHNNKNIFFCKTDFLISDLKEIEKLNNDVILISGNSDYAITDNYINLLPKNIIKWFGQNVLTNHNIFEPIPLGLENKIESVRQGHGIGYYDRVSEKEFLLSRGLNVIPSKKIYSNFQINTNFEHRYPIMEICKNSDFIDWDEPSLSLSIFFDKILDYDMVVCPSGNGVDTHRIWEVLYSNRIPITVRTGNFKIYDLYEKFPIIILEDKNDLYDLDLINHKYKIIKSKKYNQELLSFNYWKNKILSSI